MTRGKDFKPIPILTTAIILILCVIFACASRYNRYGLPQYGYEYQIPEKTEDGWETSSLEAVGVDPARIGQMIQTILDGDIENIHGVLLVIKGKLVLEEYFDGFDRDTKHRLFSASKSVTSMLVGMALDRGMIRNLDTPVYEFFPEYKESKWIERQYPVKLKDVLTMTAGLDWSGWDYPGYDSRSTTNQLARSSDWIKFTLNRDALQPSGKQFVYNNGLTMLLGGIVKNTSGLGADKFAEKHLFAPLGISDFTWDKDPNGAVNTAWGLSLKPRDMAKLGYLYLQQGNWNGRQVVSRQWVDESVKDHVKQYVFLGSGYGYQWWRGKTNIQNAKIDMFYAAGHGGQFIFVCPSLDCVAIITSKWIGNPFGEFRPQMMLVNYILPALLPTSSATALTPDPVDLETYEGQYEFKKWKLTVKVRRDENRLYLQFPKSKEAELIPIGKTRFSFYLKGLGNVQLQFSEGSSGKTDRMIAYMGFANISFDKIK